MQASVDIPHSTGSTPGCSGVTLVRKVGGAKFSYVNIFLAEKTGYLFLVIDPKKWGVLYPHFKKWGVNVPLVPPEMTPMPGYLSGFVSYALSVTC